MFKVTPTRGTFTCVPELPDPLHNLETISTYTADGEGEDEIEDVPVC